MKKILKVIPFGVEDSKYYMLFVCDSDDYKVFKKMNYENEHIIVDSLNGCKVGDLVEVKKYYNLADFDDSIITIIKIKI